MLTRILGYKFAFRIFGLMLILIGIGFGILAYKDLDKINGLNNHGVVTNAEVIDKRFDAGDRYANEGYVLTTYYIVESMRYMQTFYTSKSVGESIAVGSSIKIRYLPEDPTYAFEVGEEPKLLDKLQLVLFGVGAGLVAFLVAEFIPSNLGKIKQT